MITTELTFDEILASDNVAELLTEQERKNIAQLCINDFEKAKNARADWDQMNDEIKKLLDLDKSIKSFPWHGASNVRFPMMSKAIYDMSSRMYIDMINSKNPCKFGVLGKDIDSQKDEMAKALSTHMSYQLTGNKKSKWEEVMRKTFFMLWIYGTAIVKTFYNERKKTPDFEYISHENIYVHNEHSCNIENATSITQLHFFPRNEIESRIRRKMFVRYNYDLNERDTLTNNADIYDYNKVYKFGECHRYLDLDGDGFDEPYIVLFDMENIDAPSIVLNVDRNTIAYNDDNEIIQLDRKEFYTDFHLFLSHKNTYYSYGIGTLLFMLNASFNDTINTILNVFSLQVRQGGILDKEARIIGGEKSVALNEIIKMEAAPGKNLQESWMPFPRSEVPQIIQPIIELMMAFSKEVSGLGELLNGNIPTSNVSTETILALIEQGIKLYSAFYKSAYKSMGRQMDILYRLNGEYLDAGDQILTQEILDLMDTEEEARKVIEGYLNNKIDVFPNADPTLSSSGAKMMRALALRQLISDPSAAPRVNDHEILKRYVTAIGEENVEQIVPPPNPNPPDSPEMIQMKQSFVVADKQLAQRDRELDLRERELQLKEQELQDKRDKELMEQEHKERLLAIDEKFKEVEAILNIAKAEAAEKGQQLEEYKAFLEEIKLTMPTQSQNVGATA